MEPHNPAWNFAAILILGGGWICVSFWLAIGIDDAILRWHERLRRR